MNFIAPGAGQSFDTRGGTYTSDANGLITGVPAGDSCIDLLTAGCTPVTGAGNVPFLNMIEGGDFTVNPWQRNIAGLATANVITTAISNTLTYFADRFFAVGGASAEILMAKLADTTLPGFTSSLKYSRKASNADTAVVRFGQVLETANSVKCQGQPVTLSFWAKAGANFSAASAAVTIAIFSGTGTNQSAANMVAGSWTGQATVATATINLTSSWQRFTLTGTVAATANQLGIMASWTPVGTAGADDSITYQGIQLEIGSTASPFERRSAAIELALCQRSCFVLTEPAAAVTVAAGMVQASNVEIWALPLPVPLRAAPTVTTVVGTFKSNSATAGIVAATGLAGNAASIATVVGLTATGTGTAGQGALLQGGGGSGYIMASADF